MLQERNTVKNTILAILLYFGIPFVIFILFKKLIDLLVFKILVQPFFSYIEPSSWLFDVAIIIISTAAAFYFIRKIRKGAKISIKWSCLIIAYECMYLFYRVSV